MEQRRGIRRVGSALMVAGMLAASTALPTPAAAQEQTQDGDAQQDTAPPSLGLQDVAKATALTVRIAPSVGNLELAITVGTSIAEIRNRLAQSQSESLNLGLIGTALTGEGCDGGDPTIRPEDLPQPLRIDNREGDAAAEHVEADPAGGMAQAVRQEVRATPQPGAKAITTTLLGELGFLQLQGGRSDATVEVVDGGAARIAHAVTEFDLSIPGLLRLTGLRWEAFHRTGTNPTAFAEFTIGGAEVLGQVIPVAGLPVADVLATVNPLLEPLGIQLGLPEVERFTEPADLVRITPLVVRTAPSALRELLLGPVFDGTRDLRDNILQAIVDASCSLSSAALVAEIALGQVSGIGSTVVALGGAEAITGQVDAGSALEQPIDLLPELPIDLPVDLPTLGPSPAPTVPRVVTPPAPAPVTERPSPPTQPIGTFERICESVHPFGWPRCSEGIGPFVGIGGILAVALFGGYDLLHQNRLRRKAANQELGS